MRGQINIGSTLGNFIYNACKLSNIVNIVEIGTWNGQGSTYCIYKAIMDSSKTNYNVFSLEIDLSKYSEAKLLYDAFNIPNFYLVYGRIVEINEIFSNLEEVEDKFFKEYSLAQQKEWLQKDMLNMSNVENILYLLPKQVDLLILDGGEYSTYAEFHKLKDRVGIFVLDDSNNIKGYKIKQEVHKDHTKYTILIDEPTERNGIIVFINNTVISKDLLTVLNKIIV